MRKDIEMDVDSGDILLRKTPPAYTTQLTWISEDDFYVYGECALDSHLTFDNLIGGIGVYAEQKDSIKPIRIKFSRITGKGDKLETEYLPVNTVIGDEIIGTKLILTSDELFFRVYLFEGDTEFTMANGYLQDFNAVTAMSQNEYFLLLANQSSIYSSPLSGVGIRVFLNGDLKNSNLPVKVQSEFELDGMTVNSIKLDNETNELIIDTKEN